MTDIIPNNDENIELDEQNEDEIKEINEEVIEKPKVIPQKSPIPKFGATFPKGNQFRWWMWNNFSNKMRVWRGASRGR